MKRGRRLYGGLAFCLAPTLLLGACGDQEKPSGNGEEEQSTGRLEVGAASELSKYDVEAVQFRVLPSGALCDGTALAEKTVALAGISTDTAGTGNLSAQTIFVLMAGDYVLCMTPLTIAGAPSCECSPARTTAVVQAGKTTALSMKSECQGNPTGGISVTGKLDDPPQILDVIVDPSDANPCEQAKLVVKAVDPNGDTQGSVSWSVTGPGWASVVNSASGLAVLHTDTAGDYQVTVSVWDNPWSERPQHGTSLTIPVHVSESAFTGDTCHWSPVRDTYVRTDLDERRNDNYGCNPLLEVGTSRGGGGIPYGGADAMRMVLGFPTHLPAGATVQSAVLEMTVAGYEGTSTFPYTLDVHGNLVDVVPEGYGVENESYGQKLFDAPFGCANPDEANGMAWEAGGVGGENNSAAPAFDPAVASSATVDPVTQGKGTVVRWDITSLFLGWVADPSTNHGITITDVTSDGEFRGIRFGSREQIFGFPAEYTAAAPRLVLKLAR